MATWVATVIGIFLILMVDVIWVGSSFFVKYVIFGDVLNISQGNASADGYDIPYYLTYLCNSLFVVYLPLVGGKNLIVKLVDKQKKRSKNEEQSEELLQSPAESKSTTATAEEKGGKCPILQKTIKWALIVCPFWFAANGTYNVSQGMTSVTSNSIISSTSGSNLHFHDRRHFVDPLRCIYNTLFCLHTGLFTFILSFFFTGETFTVVKCLGIILSIGGGSLVALKDSGDGKEDFGSWCSSVSGIPCLYFVDF